MPTIRVDPEQLQQAAAEIEQVAGHYRELAHRSWETVAGAPSYAGQFRPQVQAVGTEAHARLNGHAVQLAQLGHELHRIAEDFSEADQQSLQGFSDLYQEVIDWLVQVGLLNPDGSFRTGSFFGLLAPGLLMQPRPLTSSGPDPSEPPWWGPLVGGLERVWSWFDRSIGEPLREMPETWRGNLSNARIIALSAAADGWFAYDAAVNQFIRDRIEQWDSNLAMLQVIWTQKIWAVQEPGLPADGPITDALAAMSQSDTGGNLISVVGSDLVHLIDGRGGVAVHFSDSLTGGSAGITPFNGVIVLPNRYHSGSTQTRPGNAGLIAHELAHVLQRDHPQFPDGLPPFGSGPAAGSWPYSPDGFDPLNLEYGVPVLGDFTLYMEVQSNLVGMSVEYDLLANELSALPSGSPRIAAINTRMAAIENHLATYTGPAGDAAAYIPQHYGGHGMYVGEMVKELVLGPRIPEGGWQHWLSEQGFSQEAIDRIEQIASQGTPQTVRLSGMLDAPIATPTPSPTPTATPSPTQTHTATPTPSPTPAPSSSPTSSPTSSSSATPSSTPTSTPSSSPNPAPSSTPTPSPTPEATPTPDSHSSD